MFGERMFGSLIRALFRTLLELTIDLQGSIQCMELFFTELPEAYLETYETYMMLEHFSKNTEQLLVVNYFREKFLS